MLIKNGHITDPYTGTDECLDIRIEDGLIRETGRGLETKENDTVIDASGCRISPGLIDTHVHFRDPGLTWKEDLESGSLAAARGGFTTVVCMANTRPAVDTPAVLTDILTRGEKTGIRILQAGAITKGLSGRDIADLEALAEAGAVLFTDDGIPLMDAALLRQAMLRAKDLCIPVSLHEEDPSLVPGPGVNCGRVSEALGYPGALAAAEETMAARDCALALETGARVCIQHVSSARTVGIIRAFKKLGADVHGEATPHHFTLTEEAVLRYGTCAKMNPPLRTEEDREAIIAGICDGTLDMIVTDHAPHSPEEKARPLFEAPSGIIGLETSFSLGIKSLVEPGHLTLMELLCRMSAGPSAFCRLGKKGIVPGESADLFIYSPDETWTVGPFASKASNSPFAGWVLPGRIRCTVCRGEIVWRG